MKRSRLTGVSIFANIVLVSMVAYFIAEYRVRHISFENQYIMNYSNKFLNVKRDGFFDFTLETQAGGEAVSASFRNLKDGVVFFIDWEKGGFSLEANGRLVYYKDYEGLPCYLYDEHNETMFRMRDNEDLWEPFRIE